MEQSLPNKDFTKKQDQKIRPLIVRLEDSVEKMGSYITTLDEGAKDLIARTKQLTSIPTDVNQKVQDTITTKMDAFSKTIYQDLEKDIDTLNQKLRNAISLSESLNSGLWKKTRNTIIISVVLSGIFSFAGCIFLMMQQQQVFSFVLEYLSQQKAENKLPQKR